ADGSTCARVGGGEGSAASGQGATVGGGQFNTASGNANSVGGRASWNTVGGGQSNTADGEWAAVGGGLGNRASGGAATVPGGNNNIATGNSSFAAGQEAQALGGGTFVWADQSVTPFASNSNLGTGAGQFPLQDVNSFHARATGGTRFVTNVGGTTGVWIGPGGTSWNSGSQSSLKEHFAPVDARTVLEQLAAIPVDTWNLRSEDPSIRHMGPMAEAFRAAFGLGYDDAWINTGDAEGVAFAAIQGLYQLVQVKDAQ